MFMVKIDRILVAVDTSQHSRKAFDYASFLAARCDAELVIVNVFDVFERVGSSKKRLEEIAEKAKSDGAAMLERYVSEAKASSVENVRPERTEGDAAEKILKVARREKPDMIVVGSRGLSTSREFLLGSVFHKLSHHADCPVLIVR